MTAARDPKVIETLTPKEVLVIAQIAKGRKNAAIASEVSTTTKTVEKHINSIYDKLNIQYNEHARIIAALTYLAYQRLHNNHTIKIYISCGRSTGFVDEFHVTDINDEPLKPQEFPSSWAGKRFQLIDAP